MDDDWGELLAAAAELGWTVEERGSGRFAMRAPTGTIIYAARDGSPVNLHGLLDRLRLEGILGGRLSHYRVETDWVVAGEFDDERLVALLDTFDHAMASVDALTRRLSLVWDVEAADAASAVERSAQAVRCRFPFVRCSSAKVRRTDEEGSAGSTETEDGEIDLTGTGEADEPEVSFSDSDWMRRLVDFESRLDEASRALGGGAELLAAATVTGVGEGEALTHDYELIQGQHRLRLRVTSPSEAVEFSDRAEPAIPLDTPTEHLIELLRHYLR